MEKLRGLENNNQDITKNREQRADALLNLAENIELFPGQKFKTIFSNEEHKREFIKNLSNEAFLQLLSGVNGILRGKKKEEWKMDGVGVGVGGNIFTGLEFVAPMQEDKPELLEKLLLSIKEMNKNERDIKDIALAVSATINAIHPFLDGNGRTSRFLYSILSENYTNRSKEEIKFSLSKSATFDRTEININPGLIQTKIDELIEDEVGVRNPKTNPERITNLFFVKHPEKEDFRQEIREQNKHLFLELYSKDGQYLFWSIFEFLRDNPELDREKFIKKFPNRAAILIDVLVKNLNQEQLSQILQNYRNLKKEYVEKLIGSIANPDAKEYQIDEEGQKMPLKNYFENRMNEEQEKRAEEERIEKEKKEAEQQEKQRIEEKENVIKARFDNNEGDYKFFKSSEIKSIRELEQSIAGMTKIKKQEYSKEQKIDILRKSLFALAGKITDGVSISQEQINAYIKNKKVELIEFFAQFQAISEIMDFIEKSENFAYKIHTSNDYEIPYADQDYLDRQKDISRFLDDLFSQSIYYISPSGSALRLKLFEVKSRKVADVVQPTTEQIFYSNEMVDYRDKKVVKISTLSPEQGRFVFEITTPEFRQRILAQKTTEQSVKSEIGTISDEERIYVNITEGATLHSGWRIVGIKKL